jgi:hypothetical protein
VKFDCLETLLPFILILAVLDWGSQMQATSRDNRSAGLEILPVEHLPEYVIGFPVYVAITVRSQPDSSFNRLLFADLADLRECIGVEITGKDAASTKRYVPKPIIDEESGLFPMRLKPGESRRMLADVSPLTGLTIPEGEYMVCFSFVTTKEAFAAEPVRIRFRKPTAAENAMKDAVAKDRSKFSNWAEWSVTCPPEPVSAREIRAGHPLTFSLLLRHLLCGAEPLNQVDPALLDVLNGLYAPERDALKAELYHARGDEANYKRLRSQILLGTPGLAWWIRMIDEGGAFLKSFSMRPSADE